MPVLQSDGAAAGDQYERNREGMLGLVGELDDLLTDARAGGGEKYVQRHQERGKLPARDRIELLLDRDAPFLELQSLIAHGTDYQVGGSVVTGIGVIEGAECVVIANDPTVRGGTSNPYTLRKVLRAMDVAETNRLPCLSLVESGGADLPTQAELFIPGGEQFRRLTNLSAKGIPTIALVFGTSTAGGAYIPGMSDYTVFVKEGAKVFLGGPPLVKMATGEEADDEELGGAEMHASVSGLADYMAIDELDALRLGRDIVRRLNWRKHGPGPSLPADPPTGDPEELLGVASADLKVPFDPRDILARVLDGSRFDEFKAKYGTALCTGWGSVHGFPIGVLANVRGILFSQEAQKAAQFIQLANQVDVPLLFIHNTTGFMVGRQYEQGGIIKDGAKMINAVSNSTVPHLGLIVGASFGAANYAMSGRAYRPRFLFSWPSAKSAVMGGEQLAGVLSLVSQRRAESAGEQFDEEKDRKQREKVEGQIEAESTALSNTSRGYDDGIVDPRDTRTVLGMALSACHSAEVRGADGFGVFRM